MLVTARVLRGELPSETKYNTYRMRNHPCSKWVRLDRTGFQYASNLLRALCDEYTYRFDKIHATDTFYYGELPKPNIDEIFPHRRRRKPVPLATGEIHPTDADPVCVYRRYYGTKSERWELKWTRRCTPEWYRPTRTTTGED